MIVEHDEVVEQEEEEAVVARQKTVIDNCAVGEDMCLASLD